uniref:Diacylglycerol lipase-beta n=1 Tax=Coturnix japonica TaxID=93934 RepID=A0A8C2TW24_COTJA
FKYCWSPERWAGPAGARSRRWNVGVCGMPGLVVFGRRWAIGSDDFVLPGTFELFLRLLWWLGIVVLYAVHKGQFSCPGGALLHSYLLVLLALLAAIICTLCALVYVSMQGTISNPGPRKSLPKLLYTRLLLYLPEFIWAVVGAVWVSDSSVRCESTVINVILGTVIASWVIIVFTIIGVLIVFDPLGGKKTFYLTDGLDRNLESSQSGQLLYNVKNTATRVWEKRIRLMCCCIVQDDDHRVAFTSIAELFRAYFSDTDLVPSDIAAGLILLHQEQDKMESCPKEPEEVLCHSPSSLVADDLDIELENAAHYMLFAAAAYGWPYYIYTNPFTALCKLNGDCCRSRPEDCDITGSDRRNFHFGSILRITGLQYRDFIHISFHNKIYEIPFFVALDHKKEAIVVAVRGTLSFEDILTDLSADCEDLTLEDVLENGFVHKGITQAANYIYQKLINDGILNQAFTIAPEYKLVIVGHSLGGGTASVLAIMLRNSFPTLKCYAFSPPGGLLSTQLENDDALTQPLLAEESLMVHRSPSYNALDGESHLNSPPQYPHLYLPGRIIHIVEESSSRRLCSSDIKYSANWSNETVFSSILISPKMITDHMPDVVLNALNSLSQEHRSCISCRTK